MTRLTSNEPVLLRIPSHMYEEVKALLERDGYNLDGDGNYQRLESMPYFLRKDYERVSIG